MEIKNAIITDTMLGLEDHGILTFMIDVKYEGGVQQGFGGWAIEKGDMSWMKDLLETLDVRTWEGLVGKHVRVECEYTKVHRIGHIIEDKWFSYEVHRT